MSRESQQEANKLPDLPKQKIRPKYCFFCAKPNASFRDGRLEALMGLSPIFMCKDCYDEVKPDIEEARKRLMKDVTQ